MLKEVIKKLSQNKITLLAARPASGKIGLTLEIIKELGINQNKRILWFDLEELEEWLTINLVTHISGLNYQDVYYYFHPCLGLRREKRNINQEKLGAAISFLQSKEVIINNYYAFETKDAMDYLEEYVKLIQPHFIMINSLDLLIKKSSYSLGEILKKLEKLTKENKVKFLMWTNLHEAQDLKLTNIKNFAIIKTVIDKVILLKRVKSNPFLIEGTYYEKTQIKLKFLGKYHQNLCCWEEVNASKSLEK